MPGPNFKILILLNVLLSRYSAEEQLSTANAI